MVENINKAIQTLITTNAKNLLRQVELGVFEGLKDRLSKHATFGFGFTGFKPCVSSSSLAGQLLCAIDTDTSHPRFFACNLPAPDTIPRPFEYNRGDEFELRLDETWNSEMFSTMTDIQIYDAVNDSLRSSYFSLARFVINSL